MLDYNDTVIGQIRKFAIESPNKLALIDTKHELTYEEYWNKICASAGYLKHIGVKKGEYIAIKAKQTVEYLTTCHAIQLYGAICVPLEKSANEARLIEIMEEIKATKIFGDSEVEGFEAYDIEDAFNFNEPIKEWDMPNLENDAMVLFTTGTTGKSKGIVLQYKAEFAVAENVKYGTKMKSNNVEIIPTPMNHSFSLRRYFANMINGSTVIVIDGVTFIKILFNMLEKYKATSIAMAPASLNIIFKLSRDKLADYSEQLDYIQLGSAPLPEGDKEHLLKILPNIRLYNLYGSTELGCACILDFNSDDNRANCIGYPTVNSFFKIVDENNNEIKNSSLENPGYLSYTGGMAMRCYFNSPELTSKTVGKDGYMRSNDLGYQDDQGRIYMLGRADDVIITGGNKVAPMEVEEATKKFEGIIDCICKARKDEIVGAVPILYIVANEKIDINALEAHLMELLEDFKRPREIKVIDAVPRTYNGKIDRLKEIDC